MLKKIKNMFLYAGIDRNSFERIKPKITKANLTMTTVLSTFATILIGVMLIASFNSEGVKQNKNVYFLGLILSITILLLSVTIARKNDFMVTILVCLSYTIYYLYGILIGAITDPTGKTVTFMVLLVFMPILFIDRPLRILIITSFYVVLFIILCVINKEGAVLSVDVIDAIIFGILGISSGIVVNHMKARGYTFEQKLKEISRIDQLTQTRNRNAFEFERDSIPDLCKSNLGFAYFDVNGLHEVNNEKGHDEGDRMLKYVAAKIKETFSENLTYRIGGDEFVAFIPDKTSEDIEKEIQELLNVIEKNGYYVAAGYEVEKVRHINLDNLINSAEKKMINNKKSYYKDKATRDTRTNI